jgi:hypothetical protein
MFVHQWTIVLNENLYKSGLWREIDFRVRTLGDIYLQPLVATPGLHVKHHISDDLEVSY